ncbi:hypothetical protein GUJ93_ZPchr0009g1042 [Zizania palustris]|uniref:Uncharacterized protein n=1 Tax=Zizania palustris TaxID=103762 RepID=A0A8J5VLC1_ZIZPA|nr:hypothetical protein GUJ93_ZPchr0009g1042 [Zizania palustris]
MPAMTVKERTGRRSLPYPVAVGTSGRGSEVGPPKGVGGGSSEGCSEVFSPKCVRWLVAAAGAAECACWRGPTVHDDWVCTEGFGTLGGIPECVPEVANPERSPEYWIHLSVCLWCVGTSEATDRFAVGEPGSSGRLDARGAGSSVTVAAKGVRVGPRVEVRQVKAESAERGSG